jgi:transcriptional regulator with XRE-family HTH domain
VLNSTREAFHVQEREKNRMPYRNSPEDMRVAVVFLRSLREWDQQELAAAAGLSASSISRYESGDVPVSPQALERIAMAVGLPLRRLSRVFTWIRSARTAVESARAPDNRERMAEAIAGELTENVADLLHSAAALALDGLPWPETGPGEAAGPPLAADRRRAPALWEALERRTASERRVLIEDAREFRIWALCELLCAESAQAAAGSADRAVELAELALRIAERVTGEESWRRRLQGYAWAHVGNARRVRGDQAGAEEAFARSAKLWETGAAGDPGRLLDLDAALAAPSATV